MGRIRQNIHNLTKMSPDEKNLPTKISINKFFTCDKNFNTLVKIFMNFMDKRLGYTVHISQENRHYLTKNLLSKSNS